MLAAKGADVMLKVEKVCKTLTKEASMKKPLWTR